MYTLTEVLMTEKNREYKRYPEEFKKDAVSLVLEQQYTPSQAAEAVGVYSGPQIWDSSVK